jgi:type II secretory pathway component GspD/PulD (secretin)
MKNDNEIHESSSLSSFCSVPGAERACLNSLLLAAALLGTWIDKAIGQAATPASAAASPPPAAAPATAPALNPAARNIRFQFDGIPYTDVIERFAQMANKPLVTDTNVVGTLTYNDPNPYNYGEALDTLNLVLSMKGVMLVESGNYLRLVPFRELPSMPIRILRGVDSTGDVRPGEVVTVVLDVKNLDSKEIGESIASMLSNAGSVAPLSRGRGLIVTDRLSNIQRIRTLLATIDTEATVDRQMKTYTLLHASGAIVSDLLNRTFGIATAPKRTTYNPTTKAMEVLPADPNDYITAVYDDASRTMVLFGPRERIALAEELINRFEQKDGPGGDVRIYYPQTIKAEDLASVIRQAIPGIAAPGDNASTAATKARLITDTNQNRLIVAAPIPGQLEQIEQLINRVDKPVHGQVANANVPVRSQTVQLTRVFRPRAAEATNLAQILTQALTRRSASGQVTSTASISFDAGSQSVVVSGSPTDLQVAGDIVTQLETGTSQPTRMVTRFIDVGTSAEAKRLLPLVEQLYRNQVSDGAFSPGAHAKILTDVDSSRLIVTASEDHLSRIEELIRQLRLDRPQPQARRLQIVTLRNVRAETALASLQNLVNERMTEKRFQDLPKPSIIADAPNNRLLVTATDDQLRELEQIVGVVDVTPDKPKRELNIIQLQAKPASEVIPLVNQFVSQMNDDPSQPAPSLMSDPTGKQIIVLASQRDVERIRTLVKQFDVTVASAAPRQFRGVELHSRTAAELTPLVQQLYQEQIRGQPEPAGGTATVIAEPKNNRVMISGPDTEISRVEAIIRQLDPDTKRGTKEETRVIRMKSASATDLVGIIEKSLNNQQQQVRVMVDARSNSLVISGDSSAVEAASQIIQQLDTRATAGPRELRIIELKSADATAISPMVNSLFTEMVKDKRGADYVTQTKIVPDTTANRIIVTGVQEEIGQIAELVQQLDQAPEQAPGARVFKLNMADAAMLAPIVSNAMLRFDARGQAIRRVTVTADDKSNALIISGTRADLQDVGSVIEKLDGETSGKERVLKIFDVKSEDVDALAALTLKVFAAQNPGRSTTSLINITAEPAGKRLIVLAPATLMTQVETVISTLDSKPDQGVRELQSVEVKNASATEVFGRVSQIYSEQSQGKTIKPATLYPDATGSRIMVYGTKEQAASIRQIVDTLASSARSPRETKIFDVGRSVEAQRVLPLAQQLYRDQVASNPDLGAPDAQMITDGRTGRIIVSARADQLKGIEEIINRLQVGSATNQAVRETRTFEVGSASDVQRLQPLVQQLYQDQWKDHSESDPADAQIIADAKTGRLIVTGKPDHLKQIEAILQQIGTGKAKPEARDTRIFDLSTASATELAVTVRSLYTEQSKSRFGPAGPDTLIMPDVGGNRLIVVAELAELDVVEDIIKKLDKVSAQSATARVFKLKSAEPDKVAEILTTSLVRYDALGRPQKRATVSVDAKTRTLIVTGDPKELQGVSVIIEQLDQSLGAQPERKMKVITLKQGRTSEVAARLRQLYADQVRSQPELTTSEILILEESPSNQLILAGNEGQLALADRILADLQASQNLQAPRETKLLELGSVEEMNRLLPLVQQLYQDRWKNRDASDPADAQILPDAKNGRFIVTARTNQIVEIESILAQLRGNKAQPEARDTRIFDLTTASAVELAVTVRTLYQEQSRSRPASGAADTLILPDGSANRLIVTASTNELDVVEDIIKKLDKVSAQSATARVFKLKSADPDKVVEILGTALVRYDALGRPQKRVSIVVDSKTRTLIATGDPKELQSAAVIIEQLDASLGAQPERRMKVIAVKAGRAAELATKVRQVYQDQAKNLPELSSTDPLIMEDTPSNQLILTGTDKQLSLLEQIATDLSTNQIASQPRETKMFEVGQAGELERIQPLVQQLYQERWKGKDAGDPADATILSDVKNGRLIITARTNHLKEIETIFASLNTPTTNQEPRDTRVYDLNSSSAAELVTTVKSLYQEQLKSRAVPIGQQATILPDAAANRIVVSAGSNELASVESIITKLDKVSAKTGGTRVFTLKNAQADQVSSVLSAALVQITPYGTKVPRVSVGADPQNNLVIVAGEPKDIQSAAVIIEQMDGTAAREQRQMRIIPLKSGVAAEVSRRVKQLYEDQLKGRPKTGADALIMGDDLSNRLIITANETQLKLIEEIVGKLQEAGEGAGRQLRVILLQRNSARAIASLVSQLYAPQVASTELGERLVVSPSGDDRTLVVEATAPMLTKVEELVKTMDKAEADSKSSIQAVHLTKGRAEDLAEAVTKSIASQVPQSAMHRVSVTAVSGANSLLLNGPNDALPDVLKLIKELDSESADTEIEVRIYKLENGNAKEIRGVLDQLLLNATRQRRAMNAGRLVNPTISIDDRSNSLIVSGNSAHFKVLEKLLPTLDKKPERSERDVQFVWLKKAKAYDVISKLEAVFESRPQSDRPVMEADGFNNSITIIGRSGDIAQVQDLITRLDDSSKDSNQQVRLRPLDRVSAEQMAKMLQNIYPQMANGQVRVVERVAPPKVEGTPAPGAAPQPAPPAPNPQPAPPSAENKPEASAPEVVIAVDKIANALVLSGPAQELDNLDRIINDLSYNFSGNESEFRLFPLKEADAIVVARTLTNLLRQEPEPNQNRQGGQRVATPPQHQITIVPDSRTHSIIVRARPTDFALIESIIKQLDVGSLGTQVAFRLIRLTNAPPEKVQPLVQQMVAQLQVSRPGEPLTVSVDARSHSLMVVAREAVIEQVERMIRSLDTPSSYMEAEVLVIALKKASAGPLSQILEGMLKPGAQGEWGPEAKELQEQVRRLKVVNEAGETILLDLTKPIKVSAASGSGNRLILTSTPDNLKALSAVVATLDTSAVLEGVEVRLISLKNADANSVSQTLTTVFTQGRQLATGPNGASGQPEGLTGKALTNPFNVSIDPRGNTLILSGQKETLDLAVKIINDMDQPIERFVTEVKLFRLKHASATRLLPLLQSVFTEGAAVPGTEGLSTQVTRLRTVKDAAASQTSQTAKSRAAMVLQADDLSNILVIAARSDMLPLITDVIDQLDIPAASGLETVRIYPLNHADPAAVQRILNELYTGARAASLRTEDKPVISVDERTGALIVAGNGKSFGVIEGLLAQLDQKLSFDLRDIRIIPLENSDAAAVSGTLQRLMDARLTQRANLNKGQSDLLKVVIMADERSNSLLVGGTKDSFEMVESLAKQLDKAGPALSGRIRIIPLAQADARVMASTLTSLFEQRYAAARSSDVQRRRPIIMADPRSNSLLVTANQEDNVSIDDLLKRLDAKAENPALTLTVLPLKHNDSARVASLIENIFAARMKAQNLPGQQPLPSEQIKVEADSLNNALIVSASKENLEVMQGLLHKLDVEPSIAGGVMETFTLQFADAQRVSALLKSLVDQGLYRPGLPPGASLRSNSPRDALAISVDPRSNTLLVSASPENLAIVREVIRKLDSKDFTDSTNVRLYALKKARASSLANSLEQFFTAKRAGDAVVLNANARSIPVGIIADDRVNTLLVTGGKEAFDVIERILPQLDGESVFARLNFKVFPLKKATATKLQPTLQRVVANRPVKVKGEPLDPITIVADSWVNALLVAASVDDLSTVESLIERLDSEPAESGLAIHVFPLAKADARRVAQVVQGLFRDSNSNTDPATSLANLPVTVNADERINAIIVSCGEVDAKRVGELVKKLDTEQVARVSEIKVFPLKYAKAESLSGILNTALNTKPVPLTEQSPNAQSVLQFITRTTEGKELISAALKEAVMITPDSRMNSLIVSGPVDYMGLIEQIIGRLDASSPQEAKIKVFALQNADAHQMSQLLMQLFRMTPAVGQGNARSIQYTLVRSASTESGVSGAEESLASATLGTAEQNALTVTVDPRTNSLLVGGTDHYVKLVSEIIESLDATPANERKTELVRMKNTQATEVATALRGFLDQERQRVTQVLGADAVGTAQRLLEREVAVVAEPVSNTLLISANPRYFDQIHMIILELDKAQDQVLIQVLLAEITLDSLSELGMEWTQNGKVGEANYKLGTDFGVANQVKNFGGYSTAVTGSDFTFLLRALKDEGRLEVLSRPQIVTGDNKPGTINVGQRVPTITGSTVSTAGTTVNTYGYEDVGIILSVTPKISPDGFVKMEIGTTNSAISSAVVEINADAKIPILNQRRANTTVTVQSGQSILIGGLIATTDDKRVKKMPLLGDIPWIGSLFRSTKTARDRKELLILLTPQVLVNEPNLAISRAMTPHEMTREHLDKSRIKDEIKRDALQQQLLDPLFPPVKKDKASGSETDPKAIQKNEP